MILSVTLVTTPTLRARLSGLSRERLSALARTCRLSRRTIPSGIGGSTDGQRTVIDKNVDAPLRLSHRHLILEKGRIVWQNDSKMLAADPLMRDRYLSV